MGFGFNGHYKADAINGQTSSSGLAIGKSVFEYTEAISFHKASSWVKMQIGPKAICTNGSNVDAVPIKGKKFKLHTVPYNGL